MIVLVHRNVSAFSDYQFLLSMSLSQLFGIWKINELCDEMRWDEMRTISSALWKNALFCQLILVHFVRSYKHKLKIKIQQQMQYYWITILLHTYVMNPFIKCWLRDITIRCIIVSIGFFRRRCTLKRWCRYSEESLERCPVIEYYRY